MLGALESQRLEVDDLQSQAEVLPTAEQAKLAAAEKEKAQLSSSMASSAREVGRPEAQLEQERRVAAGQKVFFSLLLPFLLSPHERDLPTPSIICQSNVHSLAEI